MSAGPKYPDTTVQLVGEDGNAYNVVGLVVRVLRDAGVPQADIDEFLTVAKSGDYDNLLRTTMSWVSVE